MHARARAQACTRAGFDEILYSISIWLLPSHIKLYHSKTLNNWINRLHKRALEIAYKDNFSNFQELLEKDNSYTIHEQHLKFLAVEMYKIQNGLAPLIMCELFPIRICNVNLRPGNNFKNHNVRTVYNGTNIVTFQGPKIWNSLPEELKKAISLKVFKVKIKKWKPTGCTCHPIYSKSCFSLNFTS